MAFTVYNRLTKNTNENMQFRRVAKVLDKLFKDDNLNHFKNGVLIGNPFNDDYQYFKADAIFYYDNGLMLFDFKNYQGNIDIPLKYNKKKNLFFESKVWTITNDTGSLHVGGGTYYINPFFQLNVYRKEMKRMVSNNKILNQYIDQSNIFTLNIFSGPIKCSKLPKSVAYYSLCDEANLAECLCDYSSSISYKEEVKDFLLDFFDCNTPYKIYMNDDYSSMDLRENKISKQYYQPNKKFKGSELDKHLHNFFNSDKRFMLINAIDDEKRDKYLLTIRDIYKKYSFSQIEFFAPSKRVCQSIADRINNKNLDVDNDDFILESLFLAIYKKDLNKENNFSIIDCTESYDGVNSLLVIAESHLITNNMNKNTDSNAYLNLLNDFMKYIQNINDFKVIFIGDPCALSYGFSNATSNAANIDELKKYIQSSDIEFYKNTYFENKLNSKNILTLKLAKAIEEKNYNSLNFICHDELLCVDNSDEVLKNVARAIYKGSGTSKIITSNSKKSYEYNLYIKDNFLKNKHGLDINDIVYNVQKAYIQEIINFDTTKTQTVLCQAYTHFKICEILEEFQKTCVIDQDNKLEVTFKKLVLADLNDKTKRYIAYVCDNYAEDKKDKDLQNFLKALKNEKIKELEELNPFEDSKFYKQMLQTKKFIKINNELIANKSDDKEKEHLKNELRKLISFYKDKYKSFIINFVEKENSLFNCLLLKHAWAVDIYKAFTTKYDTVLVDNMMENNKNFDWYYRFVYNAIKLGEKVILTNRLRLSIIENAKVEYGSEINDRDSNTFIVVHSFDCDSKYKDQLNTIENINVRYVAYLLSVKLDHIGFSLSKISKENLYKNIFTFSKQGAEDIVIEIINKGLKQLLAVSAVFLKSFDNMHEKIVKAIVKDVIKECRFEDINIDSLSAAKQSFYKKWSKFFKDNGYSLALVKVSQYYDIVEIKNDNNKFMLKLWSKASGFISKIEILSKEQYSHLIELIEKSKSAI